MFIMIVRVLFSLAMDQVYHSRTKHIDIRFHFIRDILDGNNILLRKIDTVNNSPNMLTKIVFGVKF